MGPDSGPMKTDDGQGRGGPRRGRRGRGRPRRARRHRAGAARRGARDRRRRHVRWANPAAERLFGIPVDEAIGQNGLDFIHPDDLQLAALALTSVQAKEVGTPLELRVRSADGWRLVEMIGAPLGDDLVLSVRDLTERRRWEVAGDEVARFRSLMQNAASVTMLLTRDGVVESSSGGLTRLLGLDQEWLEGRPLADLVDERDHAVLDVGTARRAGRRARLRAGAGDGRRAPPPRDRAARFRSRSRSRTCSTTRPSTGSS